MGGVDIGVPSTAVFEVLLKKSPKTCAEGEKLGWDLRNLPLKTGGGGFRGHLYSRKYTPEYNSR